MTSRYPPPVVFGRTFENSYGGLFSMSFLLLLDMLLVAQSSWAVPLAQGEHRLHDILRCSLIARRSDCWHVSRPSSCVTPVY